MNGKSKEQTFVPWSYGVNALPPSIWRRSNLRKRRKGS